MLYNYTIHGAKKHKIIRLSILKYFEHNCVFFQELPDIYIYVYKYVCIHIYISYIMYLNICILYICIYRWWIYISHIYIYVYKCVCIHIYIIYIVSKYMYIVYMYISMMNIYISHIYIYVCKYVCVYTYISYILYLNMCILHICIYVIYIYSSSSSSALQPWVGLGLLLRFRNNFFTGWVFSLTHTPQPGGPGYPFLSGSSPLTSLAWEALPVAHATASIALGIIWPHKSRHYVKVGIPSGGYIYKCMYTLIPNTSKNNLHGCTMH
jgi:hypothetical protein